ncbi:MAG: family 20 glycosylhydrolase [Phycisphaerales bacterium]|nr:family 20 glycosylhydrolase [Phycisphaerales bacterium]
MNQRTPWRIRAVQLDLARQRETLPAIGQFIRFAKDWGYNTLVLYLEGIVRTKSFPYRPKSQGYSPDDMRRIVEMASAAGLDVVPCVNTIGHAEHFTSCRQLRHLREDLKNAPMMFCPSNPKVYEFLERYLAEIVSLFPSQHFHIGCDEADQLGYCPTCRKRSREDLIITHILRMRKIMASHGKRIWIWDDMLENASLSQIAKLPRDIVMCPWNYRSELMDYDGLQGHFNNLAKRDSLTIYGELGFDVLICPFAMEIGNTLAFTEIARRHSVLGGLQTNWGHPDAEFLPAVLPATALAGALWSQPQREPEIVLAETLQRLFPSLDPTARMAVHALLLRSLWEVVGHLDQHFYLRGRLTEEEARELSRQKIVEMILGELLHKLPHGLEYDMIEALLAKSRLQIIVGRLRQVLPALVDPRLNSSPALARECQRQLQSLAELRAQQWRRHRAGIRPDHASAFLKRSIKDLNALLKTAKEINALLQLRLFLQDSYSWPRLTIELRNNACRWRQVYCGAFKPVNMRDALYTLQVPVRWTGHLPDRIRLSVAGFGGQGISFAALHFSGRSLIPKKVTRQHGQVVNAQAILNDDSSVCFLGSADTVTTVRNYRQDDQSCIEARLSLDGTTDLRKPS